MALDVTGLITSLIPSNTSLAQDLVTSAGASVVLAGLKTQAGMDAIDPLGIIHKDSPNNNPNNIVGPTITASAFSTLSPAAQAQIMAAGAHIVSG